MLKNLRIRATLKKIGLTTLVVLLGLLAVYQSILGLFHQAVTDSVVTSVTTVRESLTVGSIGTEASGIADATCDGVADDAQIQALVTALPNTGGRLYILTGIYIWTNGVTVTDASPGITISGTGVGTYIGGDGVTSPFTAGGNNWTLSDFRTNVTTAVLLAAMGATTGWSWENITTSDGYFAYRTDDLTTGASWNIPVYEARTQLLPNSGFGVWSCLGTTNIGAAIAVTGHTIGSNTVIATTANTQGLAVGKLVHFTAGDASLTTALHLVTAVTLNVNFTFTLEGNVLGAGGGAATCYEATVGGINGAFPTFSADWWLKTVALLTYRWQSDSTHLREGTYYGMKLEKGAATPEYVEWSVYKNLEPAKVMSFAGRTVVFGVSVYANAGCVVKLGIYDGVTWSWSAIAPTGSIQWLEVTKTVGVYASIDRFQCAVELQGGISDTCYISQPMLSFGSYLGAGNYAPIPNEVVQCVAHISPTHFTGMTFPAASDYTFKVEGETSGQIPKGARAVSIALEGVGGVMGDVLVLFRNSYVDPLTQGIILGCTVNGAASYGGVSLVQILRGVEDTMYYRSFGTGNWTLVSIDIVAVWY